MISMSLLNLLRAEALCKFFSLRAITRLDLNPFGPNRSVDKVHLVAELTQNSGVVQVLRPQKILYPQQVSTPMKFISPRNFHSFRVVTLCGSNRSAPTGQWMTSMSMLSLLRALISCRFFSLRKCCSFRAFTRLGFKPLRPNKPVNDVHVDDEPT